MARLTSMTRSQQRVQQLGADLAQSWFVSKQPSLHSHRALNSP